MEKLLVVPTTRGKLEALKAFLAALKIDFKSISTNEEEAAVTDPELLQRIEDYEQGKTQPQPFSLQELKAMMDA